VSKLCAKNGKLDYLLTIIGIILPGLLSFAFALCKNGREMILFFKKLLLTDQNILFDMTILTLGCAIVLVLTIYQIVEREVLGAYERLSKIQNCNGANVKKDSVIEAQKKVIRILGTCKISRFVLIRLPGATVFWMIISILVTPTCDMCVEMWVALLLIFLILLIIGTLIVFCALARFPESSYFAWLLGHKNY